jgi:uncharacterized protein
MGCTYCYQDPIRNAGNALRKDYDLDAMKAALLREGFKFTIFGGEPLLMPLPDLEELWKFGKEHFGEKAKRYGQSINGVQTNGTLITPAHIEAFKRWDVSVGMSIDGPAALNDARWMGSEERTRKATAHSESMLIKMLQEGISVSLIVTLHQLNAREPRLGILADWLRNMEVFGLRHVNLHLLQSDNDTVRKNLALTPKENAEALLTMARLQAEIPIRFAPLTDMVQLLRGIDRWNEDKDVGYTAGVSCIWNGCDPYTTAAVHGVDGQGNRGNCGRTCKEGPFWQKADVAGYERYLALYHAPQAYGGCRGCRFFYACKGHCPGEGVGNDWRAKTEHCEALTIVFTGLEAELIRAGEEPLSVSPLREGVERRMLAAWECGQSASITEARKTVYEDATVIDKWFDLQPLDIPHGDIEHGDKPHGDHNDTAAPATEHGDHTDAPKGMQWHSL